MSREPGKVSGSQNTIKKGYNGLEKITYTIPILTFPFWEDNSVHGTLEQSIRPEMH